MESKNIEWTRLASRIAMSLAMVYVKSFLYNMVKVRLLFYRLKKQGMVRAWLTIIVDIIILIKIYSSDNFLQPIPPWDPILGNIRVLAALTKKAPKDARQARVLCSPLL
jgi:hypothetical protein